MAEGILGRLDTIYTLSKNLLDLHDAIARQGVVAELQKELLAAQRDAFATSQAHVAQITEIRDLKEEVARLKAWGADKKRYEMQRVDSGVILYALRPECAEGEPLHQLCAHCYDRGEKSKLQPTPKLERRFKVHHCPLCKSEFAFGYVPPPPPGQAIIDWDPFGR